jgi:hypothetical protein
MLESDPFPLLHFAFRLQLDGASYILEVPALSLGGTVAAGSSVKWQQWSRANRPRFHLPFLPLIVD